MFSYAILIIAASFAIISTDGTCLTGPVKQSCGACPYNTPPMDQSKLAPAAPWYFIQANINAYIPDYNCIKVTIVPTTPYSVVTSKTVIIPGTEQHANVMENIVTVKNGWINVTTSNINEYGQQIMVLLADDELLVIVFCANNAQLQGTAAGFATHTPFPSTRVISRALSVFQSYNINTSGFTELNQTNCWTPGDLGTAPTPVNTCGSGSNKSGSSSTV